LVFILHCCTVFSYKLCYLTDSILSRCFITLDKFFPFLEEPPFVQSYTIGCSPTSSTSLIFASSLTLSNLTQHGKASNTSARYDKSHISLTIYLQLSDRRHSTLHPSRVVSTRREHIVIASPAVCEIPFETKGTVVSYFSRNAIAS